MYIFAIHGPQKMNPNQADDLTLYSCSATIRTKLTKMKKNQLTNYHNMCLCCSCSTEDNRFLQNKMPTLSTRYGLKCPNAPSAALTHFWFLMKEHSEFWWMNRACKRLIIPGAPVWPPPHLPALRSHQHTLPPSCEPAKLNKRTGSTPCRHEAECPTGRLFKTRRTHFVSL